MYKIIIALFAVVCLTSCGAEEPIEVNPDFMLSFERDGNTTALAGTPFYVILKGSGEFVTLYDGNTGKVYGEAKATGSDFNLADSMMVTYSTAGTYKLTVVSTSAGDYGETIIRKEKTVDITVVDQRNSITEFYLNIDGVDKQGAINSQNEILFSLPDIYTSMDFKAIFKLDSNESTVFVNGQQQTSNVTINDFKQNVVYTVKSKEGTEKTYTVKIATFPPSSENLLTKFELGKNEPTLGYSDSNGEVGVIDHVNGIINLAVNYATVTTRLKFTVESSPLSTVMVGTAAYSATNRRYNLTTTAKELTIVAQNKAEKKYSINLSLQNPVSEFTFAGLVPAPVGVINTTNKTITIDVLKGTDITKLVAKWKGSVGTVRIGSVNQTNGVTVNDFTTPKVFTFYKGTTAGDVYTVTVIEK